MKIRAIQGLSHWYEAGVWNSTLCTAEHKEQLFQGRNLVFRATLCKHQNKLCYGKLLPAPSAPASGPAADVFVCEAHKGCTQTLLSDIEELLGLQDPAQLEASWEKLRSKPKNRNAILPVGNYLHSQMRMTQIARAVTTCWENIIWRTEWATSTPIPPCCAHFSIPLTVYEGKSAVACLQEQLLCIAWFWVSKICRQTWPSQARPWLGLDWRRIGNCLALSSSVIEGALGGAPWEWGCSKQCN